MTRLTLCLALLPSLALAKGKVVIDAPKPVAAAIEKSLKAKFAAKKSALSPEPTSTEVKDACRAAGAAAVITARPLGSDVYNVMVLNGADGSPLATLKLKAGKKLKALPKPELKALLAALAEARPPGKKEEQPGPPPEEARPPAEEKAPTPVAERPAEAERTAPSEPAATPGQEVRATARASSAADKKPIALRLGVGFKLFSRRFGYRDDVFNALPGYTLPAGPAIAAELDLYPAAFLTSSVPAHIGVLGQFDYAVAIASKSSDGTRYPTTAMNLKASLTVRIPISVLTANPFFGYALQTYGVGPGSDGTKPNVPSVSYGGLRGGLALKLKLFGPLAFHAHVAGTYLLSKGELAQYFPHLTGGGLDAGGAFSVSLFDRVELRVGGDYQRYWFAMNPEVGDANVAGGALDIYASGTAGLAFTL